MSYTNTNVTENDVYIKLEDVNKNIDGLGHSGFGTAGQAEVASAADRFKTKVGTWYEDSKKLNSADATLKLTTSLAFLEAINGSMASVGGAIAADRQGDVVGVASNSLSAIGTTVKAAGAAILLGGPELFPVALLVGIVGAVIEFVGSVTALFRKAEESLVSQIAQLLIRASADELHDHLGAASEELSRWERSLQSGSVAVQSWSDLNTQYNIRTGTGAHFIGTAGRWMLSPNNQTIADSWTSVFEAYSTCMHLQAMVYLRQYAGWVRYREAQLVTLKDKADSDSLAKIADLTKMSRDADDEMKVYFESTRSMFRDLHWLGRNMAPVWHRGGNNQIYRANVAIVRGNRTGDRQWTDKNIDGRWEEFAVVQRNESVDDGACIWGWNSGSQNEPYYRDSGPWTPFRFKDSDKDIKVASFDVAFLDDMQEKAPLGPDATPVPGRGVDALVALEATKNVLHLRYIVPETGKAGPDPATDPIDGEHKRSFATRQPRQVHLRRTDNGTKTYVQIYALCTEWGSAGRDADQIYLIDSEQVPMRKVVQFGPPLVDIKVMRIYVDTDYVWVLAAQRIYRRAHNTVLNDAAVRSQPRRFGQSEGALLPWEVINNPPQLSGNWAYLDIHPGDDGMLLATVGDRYFAWTQEDGWHADPEAGGNYGQIARLPLGGFRMFRVAWDVSKSWQEFAKVLS